MTFTGNVPTALSMKLKFPEFVGTADATIEYAIEEALLGVDDTWIATQATLAIMYLAAHYLVASRARAESGTGQVIKSETMDGMSRTYADVVKPISSDYSTTEYGQRFTDLRDNSFPAAVLLV